MDQEHAIYVMDHPSKQRLQTKQIINQIKQFKNSISSQTKNKKPKKPHTQ